MGAPTESWGGSADVSINATLMCPKDAGQEGLALKNMEIASSDMSEKNATSFEVPVIGDNEEHRIGLNMSDDIPQ